MNRVRKSTIILTVLVVCAVFGYLFRYDIHDFVKLYGYTPPAEIEALADGTTMHGDSRRLFYINKPVIADKNQFNEHCRRDEHSIVLGCYLPGQRGIYVLDVTDDRLEGIEEVTAAHEVLHAAYERLDSATRTRIDALLQDVFKNLTNQRIKDTVEQYRSQDASVVPNELHSILGTEVRSLTPELETYYERYFTDRSRIVTLSEQYEQAFIDRRNQVRDYDRQLADLKQEIDSKSQQIEQLSADLVQLRNTMNSYRSSGQTDAYNELVPVYNQRVGQYNFLLDNVSAQIVIYNDLVQKRNTVASEEAELVEAIDSRDVIPQN